MKLRALQKFPISFCLLFIKCVVCWLTALYYNMHDLFWHNKLCFICKLFLFIISLKLNLLERFYSGINTKSSIPPYIFNRRGNLVILEKIKRNATSLYKISFTFGSLVHMLHKTFLTIITILTRFIHCFTFHERRHHTHKQEHKQRYSFTFPL